MDKENRNHSLRSSGTARVLLVFLLGITGGCKQEDADGLSRIGRKSLTRAQALTGDANHRLAAGWQAIHATEKELPLPQRVATRLQWDKQLAGAEITVYAVQGAVELRGKVRDAEQRQRAVDLAQATAGVETVKDTLEVAGLEP